MNELSPPTRFYLLIIHHSDHKKSSFLLSLFDSSTKYQLLIKAENLSHLLNFSRTHLDLHKKRLFMPYKVVVICKPNGRPPAINSDSASAKSLGMEPISL